MYYTTYPLSLELLFCSFAPDLARKVNFVT